MNKLLIAAVFALAPLTAIAMPAVGDMVGKDPAQATASLEKAGCLNPDFEAEDGHIEAKCHDAGMKRWEVYIDPRTGKVAKVKAND
ncbi:PepSY domain-containing protein [Breoghania sp.]|uniref:PepSY domain-containing protein n=1 Tax=Breoghania sp. TaxID=2065378 RepID=UPI002AA6DCE3|nr:PepSY domain-containing protein [Breoghania sp.]